MPAPAVNDMAAKLQAEKKALEACQLECTKLVESMRDVMPAKAAKIKAQLDEMFNSQPRLSADFKREILDAARIHECAANTRAADACLNDAMAKAKANDLDARNKLVGAANAFARKATLCGADAAFQSAFDRRVEIIMMTGSGKFSVPKPEAQAPAPQNPPAANAKPAAGAPPKSGSANPKPTVPTQPAAAGAHPKPQSAPPLDAASAASKPPAATPPNPGSASPKKPPAAPPNPGSSPKPQATVPPRPAAATPKPPAALPHAAKT